jgi:hypothetical protein
MRAAESGGDPNAKNPNSSAEGADQFISSTWLDTIKAARPDIAQGKSDAELLDLRRDPELSGQMRDYYAQQNQAILQKNGLPVTPGSTYLAHFAGPQGAIKILQADPNTPVGGILGDAAMKANPFLQGMTAQGLQAWAAKKMGANSPIQTAAPASPASPPAGLPAAPQAPIFPAQPQQTQQPQQAEAPAFAQIPDQQAAPIFFAPRPRVNLTNLRAQLARAPIFSKG